jgi:hypothetical protein
MYKRWNRPRAFAWGACIGAIGGCLSMAGSWRFFDGAEVLAAEIGKVMGQSVLCGLIFGLAAVARDRAFKRHGVPLRDER